jgi:hypothetical protein
MGKLTIIDATPPSASITLLDPVPLNTAASVTASLTDVNTGNSNMIAGQYRVDGGAWTEVPITSSPSPAPSLTFTMPMPSVKFSTSGVHTVCVRGKDAGGNLSPETGACGLLAVYDPANGFVTGGGWIDSPGGAYTRDITLRGKANFGFVSKYQKGATSPTGSTEFQFQAGNLNFKSTAFDWLVISGPQAQYKGTGTINGSGAYGFILTGVDGQVSGGGGTDKFRIKITDGSGSVVYDNMLGASDTATPSTVIGGGRITIQSK